MAKLQSVHWAQLEQLWELAQRSPMPSLEAFLAAHGEFPREVLAEFARIWLLEAGARTAGNTDQVGTATAAKAADEFIGKQFGAYTVERVIGSGGASTVFLGRRVDENFEHVAAIKVLNAFVDDASVGSTQFEREQQVLARLRHPFVTQYIDSGTTEQGRGFVIVEYVDGSHITDHVRNNVKRLSDVLGLFEQVCMAVDYLHRHLVVHRDLKPSNILIGYETGTPKLLDFGVAKLFEKSVTDAEATQTFAHTPSYASPEQIAQSEFVGVASDVYSLGVVLYELVFGHRPWDLSLISIPDRLEAQRHISVPRINRASCASSIDNMNQGQLRDLRRLLKHALEPDIGDRYDSARELLDDLRRLSRNQPIAATMPSLRYRAERLFARRRSLVVVSTLLVVAMLAGLGMYGLQSSKIIEQAGRIEATKSILTDILASPDPVMDGKDVRMIDVLRAASDRLNADTEVDLMVRAEVNLVLGRTFLQLTEYERGLSLLRRAREIYVDRYGKTDEASMTARVWETEAMLQSGDYDGALPISVELNSDYERLFPNDQVHRGRALLQLAMLQMYRLEDFAAAEATATHAVALTHSLHDPEGDDIRIQAQTVLGLALSNNSKLGEALVVQQAVLDEAVRKFGSSSPAALTPSHNLAVTLQRVARYPEAAALQTATLELALRLYGDASWDTFNAMYFLGISALRTGQFSRAEELLTAAYQGRTKLVGSTHVQTQMARIYLAEAQMRLGRLDPACEDSQDAYRVLLETAGPDSYRLGYALKAHALCLELRGDVDQARSELTRAFDLWQTNRGADNWDTLDALHELAMLEFRAGNVPAATAHVQMEIDALRRTSGDQDLRLHTALTLLDRLTAGQAKAGMVGSLTESVAAGWLLPHRGLRPH